ncbi:MAG TPA: hypothetical protein VMH81_35990 [Bryobacteraceae bacterium]|nr:hypothetical protein [Bryobacteraceae bacterium]
MFVPQSADVNPGMKPSSFLLAMVLCGALPAQRLVTNDDVVKMAHSGVAGDVMVKTILESATRFDVSPECLINLKRKGVSDDVVRAMMTRVGGANQGRTAFAVSTVPVPETLSAHFEMDVGRPFLPQRLLRPKASSPTPDFEPKLGGVREVLSGSHPASPEAASAPPQQSLPVLSRGVTTAASSAQRMDSEIGPAAPVKAAFKAKVKLTNADILKWKAAGESDEAIISRIRASGADYKLDVPDLLQLKMVADVSDAVINAMVIRRGHK